MKEFETSWLQLFNIDNRRGIFFNYFNVAFFVVLSLTASSLWSGNADLSLSKLLGLTVIYVLLIFMAAAVRLILESERSANVRYRKKINLIRELYLSDSNDPKIQLYLNQKELGIKTFSDAEDVVGKVGGTLKPIFMLLLVQQISLGLLCLSLWTVYLIDLVDWLKTG